MNKNCTIYRSTDIIGKKWSLLVLFELYRQNITEKRYSEIKRALPRITPKLLSLRLKELEKNGLITKKIDATTFPVKSIYKLTKAGEEFIDVIKSLKKWSLKWHVKSDHCKSTECKYCNVI
ncbi:MAG: helix-turn-helix domain-containing protein [Candidatus Woesearchaeota archaeon]